MAKYENHLSDEKKFQCTLCEYGRGDSNGKSRQSVNRHYNATHGSESADPVIIPIMEDTPDDGVDLIEDEPATSSENPAEDVPDWYSFDMSQDEEDPATISISPGAATVLKNMHSNPDSVTSPAQLKDFYAQQARMMKWVFKGAVDPLFGWYGRAITADSTFAITRSSSDWKLFEDVSASWLAYREIQLPITPDIIMGGTILSMYAPVLAKVNRKRSPDKPSLFKRWRTKKMLKKALKADKKEEETWAKD